MTRAIMMSEKYIIQYFHPYTKEWIDSFAEPEDTLERADDIYRNNLSFHEARRMGFRYRIILRQILETDLIYDEVVANAESENNENRQA